jgi:hypothetical protein
MVMNPDQQQPNYDFIMNTSKGSKGMRGGAASKKQRIIVVIGGLLLVIILGIIASNVISATTGKASKAIIDLAAYQTELKRVIALGNEKTKDSTLRNNSLIATYTLESDYQQTVKIMKARGIKAPKDVATRYSNPKIDASLDTADKSNSFDAKYGEIYTQKLTNYKAKLSEVYPLLAPKEQAYIKAQNNHVKLLLGEKVN